MFTINLGGEGEVPGVLNQQGPWVLRPGWVAVRTLLPLADILAQGHAFVICDNTALPFADGCVDIVITNDVPIDHHALHGPGVQTTEVHRILKSGGQWLHDGVLRWTKP